MRYRWIRASLTSSLLQPEPLKNLNELVKAQLIFYSTAAEALSTVQGEIEELSVAAEGEYRQVETLIHRATTVLTIKLSGNPATIDCPESHERSIIRF